LVSESVSDSSRIASNPGDSRVVDHEYLGRPIALKPSDELHDVIHTVRPILENVVDDLLAPSHPLGFTAEIGGHDDGRDSLCEDAVSDLTVRCVGKAEVE